MRKRALPAMAIAALAATAFAFTAIAGDKPAPTQDQVYGAGTFKFPFNESHREFTVLAIAKDAGKAAYGSIEYGVVETGQTRFVGRVTCLELSGNRAYVAGIVTESFNPDWVGLEWAMWFEDNARAGSTTRDGAVPFFIHLPEEGGPSYLDCTFVDSPGFDGTTPYAVVEHGQVAIEDA